MSALPAQPQSAALPSPPTPHGDPQSGHPVERQADAYRNAAARSRAECIQIEADAAIQIAALEKRIGDLDRNHAAERDALCKAIEGHKQASAKKTHLRRTLIAANHAALETLLSAWKGGQP